MSEASKIALSAIGKQDTHLLSKNPKNTLFNLNWKQHSDFRQYHKTRTVDNQNSEPWWPFGHTVKVEFNPKNMGDILTNLWIKIPLPAWGDDASLDTTFGGDGNIAWKHVLYGGWHYADFVGRKIIKNIKFIVDENVLQELDSEMLVIFDQLYKTYDQKVSLNNSTNLNRLSHKFSYANDHLGHTDLDAENNLFIPIPFFFSQNYGGDAYDVNDQRRPAFPLCAIFRQKVYIEIEFYKPTHFIFARKYSPRILPSRIIENFKIVTGEIKISDKEKFYHRTVPQDMVVETIKKHSSRDINFGVDRTFHINLEPKIPVKIFHWFFRLKHFEEEGDYHEVRVQNRNNFMAATTTSAETPTTIMKNATFVLNGTQFPNVTKLDGEYFKRNIHYLCKLSEPGLLTQKTKTEPHYDLVEQQVNIELSRAEIFSYNFAMYPKSTQPSGFLDFSQLNSDKTKLIIDLSDRVRELTWDDAIMYLYYTGYMRLRFNNGFISLI
jgi:hypothetical protein